MASHSMSLVKVTMNARVQFDWVYFLEAFIIKAGFWERATELRVGLSKPPSKITPSACVGMNNSHCIGR
jgi:hypothetical protein